MLKRLTMWLQDLIARVPAEDAEAAPAYTDEDAQAWAQLLISAEALDAPPPLPDRPAATGDDQREWTDLVERARTQAVDAVQSTAAPTRRSGAIDALN